MGSHRSRDRRRHRVCWRLSSASRTRVILVLLIVACAAGGVLGRDWWLSEAVSKRDAEIIAEFPVVAEMLALAVTAGEGPMSAIDRITRLAQGPLVQQLAGVLAETRSGTPFLTAITHLRDRTRLEPLARFLDGMAVAIERGTPARRRASRAGRRRPRARQTRSCSNPAVARKSP